MVRRLVAVVLAGVLGVGALGACRAVEVGSAAYVGDTRLTQQRVDEVVAGYQRYRQLSQQAPADRASANSAEVADLVFLEVARRYAAEQHLAAPATDYAGVSQQLGGAISATDPWLRVTVDVNAYWSLLLQRAKQRTPTDAELREVYQRLVDQGVRGTYEQLKPQLGQITNIGSALSLRDELTTAVRRYGVDVNPRYGTVAYPLAQVTDSNTGQAFQLVTLPLSAPPVVDAQ